MNYQINEQNRTQMHIELDRIITEINVAGYDPKFCLPDLTISLTKVSDDEIEDTNLTIGVEFVEFEDGHIEVEERFINMRIVSLVDPKVEPYVSQMEWETKPNDEVKDTRFLPTDSLGAILGILCDEIYDTLVREGLVWFANNVLTAQDAEDFFAIYEPEA